MSDIKLFRTSGNKVQELKGTAMALERPLQQLIERNLEAMFGIRFVASEHYTGKVHNGYIDSLGLDENGFPVIIEYKRSVNENVINQGLFYLDWLMDHQADFKLMVLEKFGKQVADAIDFRGPRLICIAGDFTRYDGHAVKQMNRNIELIRYKKFEPDLLLLESLNVAEAKLNAQDQSGTGAKKTSKARTFTENLTVLDPKTRALYQQVRDFLTSLGDDVQVKTLEQYEAYKRLKNFACITFTPTEKLIKIYVNIDPKEAELVKDMVMDVSNIGHWGTGHLLLKVRDAFDLQALKKYLIQSYEQN